jgi:MFS family permease
VAALMSTSIMVGNGLVDRLAKRCGHRTTLLIWAGTMMAIGVVLVGLAQGPITAVIAFMAVGASMGVVGPVRQAYMHALMPSSSRASVISFDSMIGNSGGVVGQIGLGRLSQSVSIASGYVAGGLSLALAVPLLVAIRRRRDAADRIVGDAGVPSACAAQGLPGVLGVDVDVLTPVGEVP